MQQKCNKLLSFLLMLSAVVGLLTGFAEDAHAASMISYQEASYDVSAGVTYTTKTASNATDLTSSTTNWSNGGWYYVSGTLTISGRITVSGTANLILCDGATLTATAGIGVNSGNTLNIYAQTNGTGTLTAMGSSYQAGIGGTGTQMSGQGGGTVTIHGGNITATGGYRSAGIGGGGNQGAGGTVTIFGGSVTATGNQNAGYAGAGIGGGSTAAGGKVYIYGGTVTANGSSDGVVNGGAGIGGGSDGAGNDVYIYGGTVITNGGNIAQGIGQGSGGSGNGTLTVGSDLVVYGDSTANPTTVIPSPYSTRQRYMKVAMPSVPYVEMSFDVTTGQVTSEEKTVDAYTFVSASTTAWSNGGWYYVSGEVSISSRITVSGTANLILCDGAELNATSGITVVSGNTLNIYAQSGGTGTLTAAGGSTVNAGIGGGDNGAGGTVNIHGGTVTATGGVFGNYAGAGIGGGSGGAGGTVTIYGGTVNAAGGNSSAQGIGKGDNGSASGTLTVGSSLVVYGGSTADPTDVIPSPYSSRPQYMKVVPSSQPPVSYVVMTFDATTLQVTSAEKSTSTYTIVSPDITAWSNDTWYVVSGSVQVSGVTVTRTANLILCDGATLTASGGITLASGHTLKIYAQSGGTGSLTVTGSIGSGGTLTIHGGNISATGNNAAAIACTSVDVYSGNVTANGGSSASGITGTITVSSTLRVFGGSTTSAINVLTDYSSNRPQYMRVATPHVAHSFSNYQLSEDGFTITAVCANDDHLCGLPNATATLTILAPTAGGGAASLSGDVDEFEVSASNITYAQRSGGNWGSESSNVPTGSGFFRASITVGGVTASVTYGVNAITVKSGIENGTVTAPVVATVSAEVPLTISPNTGYELDTITVSTDSVSSLTIITGSDGSKSFIMPNEEVSVNATFKLTDYTISFDVTSGSIIVPETANYQNTVRLIISPDVDYGVYSITTTDGVTLNLVSKDTDTGVEIYEFDMPAGNVSFDITFAETTIYTIFYMYSNATSIDYRFHESDDVGFSMRKNAQVGSSSCWGGQVRAAKGRTSFPIAFNVNNDGWGDLEDRDVVDPGSITDMTDGQVILVEGDESAFVAAFVWGTGSMKKYYFVLSSTASISVPNPSLDGYDFIGWSYVDKDNASKTISANFSGNTTVNINGNIDKTTSFGAIWHRKNVTVTYDLNGGTWSNADTASVSYGGKATQPTDPAKSNYAFNGWTVKSSTRAMNGTQALVLAAGSTFNFTTTSLTDNITLKAAWKHVHSYAHISLSNLNRVISGALTQDEIDQYGPYMHFSLCSLADDYHFEAHKYDKNGKCVCGAEKPTTEVTLEETYGNRNSTLIFTSKPKKDSEVVLVAPSMGTDQFVKWEYRSLNGSTWQDLTSSPVVGFIIPGSLRVNAVYQSMSSPELTLKAERYGTDGLLFTMQYALPRGWKATDAALIYGDNHMMRYMEVVRSSRAAATLGFSDPFLGIPIADVDIGPVKEETYYYDREDNILDSDSNKGPLRYKMLSGEAVNIPGYNEATCKTAQSLGQTNGYAYGGLTGVKNANSGNHYIYVLGLVQYTDADNANRMVVVGPIAVTYNSLSSAVTDTEIYTYNNY